jgi:protease-4
MTPEQVDAVARGKVWSGQQAIGKGLVNRIGGLREALEEARRLARLPGDAPIVEWPEEDDSLLGVLLNLVGLKISTNDPLGMLPAAVLPFAQMLSPFMVFDPSKPLARAELIEELDGPAARGKEPDE